MNNDGIFERDIVHSLDRQYISKTGKSRTFGKIQRCFVEVIENVLRDDLALFEGGEKIWLNQCEIALSHLGIVITLMQNLYIAIDDCSRSPITVSVSCNVLLVKLRYADMQLCELLGLVTAFRSVDRNGPKRTGKKREEICHRFKLFMVHWNDLLQNIALQEEHVLERLAQHTSKATIGLSSSVLTTCQSSGCQLQPLDERERVNFIQQKQPFPDYLRLVPIGSIETPRNLSQEAEEGACGCSFAE